MKLTFLHKGELNSQQRVLRLRGFTALFFCLLLLPICGAYYLLYCQFEKEQITNLQHQTDKVTAAINKRLLKRNLLANNIAIENFDYYLHKFNPETQELTKAISPLSEPKLYTKRAGLVGYFQIDQKQNFNSPACTTVLPGKVPDGYLTEEVRPELLSRRKLTTKLFNIVEQSTAMKSILQNQDLETSNRFDVVSDVPGYFVFYRIVVVNSERKLQGFILNRQTYVDSYLAYVLSLIRFDTKIQAVLTSPKAQSLSRYATNDKGEVLQLPANQAQSTPTIELGKGTLSWPYKGYKVVYSTSDLKLSSEAILSFWLMLTTLIAVGLGCFGFYRLGVKQLKLAEQRLNFVSSVSHELKTPVTSIRMYAEMLSAGQVLSAQHQAEYFQFITSESERLTRLIDNILQLTKLNQPHQSVKPEYIPIDTLVDIIKSKVSSILVEHEFSINFEFDLPHEQAFELYTDIDVISQSVINIMDNAVKFFDKEKIQEPNRQVVDFVFSKAKRDASMLKLSIRDHGMGVTPEREKKLFELFYRGGNELTRSTQGTGIGLALVKELVLAQGGEIEAKNMSPGLAINIFFNFKATTKN